MKLCSNKKLILDEITRLANSKVGLRTTELDLLTDVVPLMRYEIKDIIQHLLNNGDIITLTEKRRSVYCWFAPKGAETRFPNLVACKPFDL